MTKLGYQLRRYKRDPSLREEVLEKTGLKPIHLACCSDDTAELVECLKRGDPYYNIGTQIVVVACLTRSLRILEQLLVRKVEGIPLLLLEIPRNILRYKILTDSIVMKALAVGAKTNIDVHGEFLLERAMKAGLEAATIQELVDRISGRDRGILGTALYCAWDHRPDLLLLLLKAGAKWHGSFFITVFSLLFKRGLLSFAPEILRCLIRKGYTDYSSADVLVVLFHYLQISSELHGLPPEGCKSYSPSLEDQPVEFEPHLEGSRNYLPSDVAEMVRWTPATSIPEVNNIFPQASKKICPAYFFLARELEGSNYYLRETNQQGSIRISCARWLINMRELLEKEEYQSVIARLVKDRSDFQNEFEEDVLQTILIHICNVPDSPWRNMIELGPADYRYLPLDAMERIEIFASCRTVTKNESFRNTPNEIIFSIIKYLFFTQVKKQENSDPVLI